MKLCLRHKEWAKAPDKPPVCNDCGRSDYRHIGWLLVILCAVLVAAEALAL